MKILNLKTLALQVLAILAVSAAAASDYKGLAMDLARTARENGINRLALAPFSSASGAENEARLAEEKTASGLAAQKDLEVLDQAALEAYAGSKNWLDKLPSKMRPQAFIKGSVFKEGEDITLMLKLVDARSGRVLRAMEIKSKAHFTELPAVPDINWSSPVAMGAMQDDFRDAPADNTFNCTAAFKELTRLNTAAVDLKARYWARKMKEPGFSFGSLSRNPGSEIRDFQVKNQFYELLAKYHEQDLAPSIPAAQSAQLESFMEKEDTVIDRCGIK